MCRHLGWLGAPRTVASLVLDPPYGLLRQSYAPRRQARGLMNADGWGVGFYPAGGSRPARWRSARPLWGDASFSSVAPALASGCILAAVRSATVGMPIEESAAAPFAAGAWLLSHNGRVDRDVLKPDRIAESACDSAWLAAEVFTAGPERLGDIVCDIASRGPGAVLNLLATDGQRLLATTWGDTLSYRVEPDGVLLVSEPIDDEPGWVDVPDRRLVTVSRGRVLVSELEAA
jgi:gamma-glutamyl hercynylcysteine S-oxide hydrolase